VKTRVWLALLALVPQAALAQDTALVQGGIYQRPYIFSAGRTAVGGYVEANGSWFRTDGISEGPTFEVRRFNIFLYSGVGRRLKFTSELEFEHGTEEIALERHREWFAARLATNRCHLFVMCAGELPVGQIRFDRDGTEARIGYSIDPLFRGRGWGTLIVALGVKQLLNSGPITFRADVKETNVPSRSVFGRLGFEESICHEGAGLRTYRFDPTVRSLPSMN
jgi:RimJ/RimL family protein N-acetyltransferase